MLRKCCILEDALQYSCLENPMDRGAWWASVHAVAKRRTFQETEHEHMHLLLM